MRFFDTPQAARTAGFRACRRCRPDDSSGGFVERTRSLLEDLDRRWTLRELSASVGVSPFHLQRAFKRALGVSPSQYVRARRARVFRERASHGAEVLMAGFDAGFGASSRLYEAAPSELGMTPGSFSRGGVGSAIATRVLRTKLGPLLVATTPRGVCAVRFGESAAALERALRDEVPRATFVAEGPMLDRACEAVQRALEGRVPPWVPLDVRATAFQRRAWEAIRAIAPGKTASYRELAAKLGMPNASRAVARACASNPIALLTPCHRVVRSDGALSGYRWGAERKAALLDAERAKSKR